MYLRSLAASAYKEVSLKRVMLLESAPVPLSLFAEDGTVMSGTKSDFMHELEERVTQEKITRICHCNAAVVDGHAF